jgi:hypothetical protein
MGSFKFLFEHFQIYKLSYNCLSDFSKYVLTSLVNKPYIIDLITR